MTQRLKQFWNFGHNCAVLGIEPTDLTTVLEDNRFNTWALSKQERATFMEGFETRPLQWNRKNLFPIDVRPIVHELNERNNPDLHKPRGTRLGYRYSAERKAQASTRSKAFWQSEQGKMLRKKQSQDFKMVATTRNVLRS